MSSANSSFCAAMKVSSAFLSSARTQRAISKLMSSNEIGTLYSLRMRACSSFDSIGDGDTVPMPPVFGPTPPS
ncbi:hypothetical protein D3C83_103580 [compost metagenome]